MAYTVSKLIKIAQAEVGYKEKETNSKLDNKTANAGNENYTKYARDLNKAGYYNGNKNGFDWCDVFVDWCFYQLCDKNAKKAQAMIYQTGDCGAGCVFSAQYYKNAKRYYTSNPKVGDQVFFGDFEHTGIVEKVDGKTITTIEGNTGNQVKRCTHKVGDGYVTGFGRPKYEAEPKKETTTKKEPVKAEKQEVKTYTIKRGDTLANIAKTYDTTVSEIAAYNKISNPNIIYVGQKIKIPVEAENKTIKYTIKKGDTLSKIAQKYGITLAELKKANTQVKNFNLIYVGQKINIPK